jgi:hypothetical protein
MNKLIITADDFGVCEFIDEGILQAIRQDHITSVAVISNGEPTGWDRVNKLNQDFGDRISIGCHFNVTNGKPLVAWPRSFTRRYNGERLFKWILGLDLSNLNLGLLEDELEEQVARFEAFEIPITHFSDHFGVLTVLDRSICDVVIRVVKDYNRRHPELPDAPLRNPYLSSVLSKGCLNDSELKRKGRLANFLRKLHLGDDDAGLQLFDRNLRRRHQQYYRNDVMTTDFFIDRYYGIDPKTRDETLNCLLSHELLGTKSTPPSTMSKDSVFEMVVHLGADSHATGTSRKRLKYYNKYWKFNKEALSVQRPFELHFLADFHSLNAQRQIYQLINFQNLTKQNPHATI